MWDEYEKQKRSSYMDILDSYKDTYTSRLDDFKVNQKALDRLLEEMKQLVYRQNPVSHSIQKGNLLSGDQFKLVTKWLRTDKFFNTLYPKHRKLLNDIVKDDKLPTKIDRVELNKIREEWIRYINL